MELNYWHPIVDKDREKKSFERFTRGPFYALVDSPERRHVVRIVNTATVEFLFIGIEL